MVYQKSTKTLLLFGGGNSDAESLDATGMTKSLGDTWEYDPATKIWAKRAPSDSPSIRHDVGLVWDDSRNRAVLFAGLQTDIEGILGIPKQDIWDWDPAAGTWTERTAPDIKPSARFAHAMAFDVVRKTVLVFGGMDINTGLGLNDLWEWDPAAATWQKRLTGDEAGIPSDRIFASLVATDAKLQLVAGAVDSRWSIGKETGTVLFFELAGIREVWDLDPATLAFTDRSPVVDVPSARQNPAMAYSPATGKTYLFGGQSSGVYLDDLWAWDGNGWTPIATDVRPSPRYYAAMAYDPVRKSLILYGGFWSGLVGTGGDMTYVRTVFDDTWELGADGKWTELHPASKPLPTQAHTMATDTVRNKVLLYGGAGTEQPIPGVPYTGFYRNHVWEWDGSTMSWTDRSPPAASDYPYTVWTPSMTYDDLRQKLFVLEFTSDRADNTWFWEWDAISAGWSKRQIGESPPDKGDGLRVVYDPVRKREVIYTDARDASGNQETWEIDSQGPTWYVRSFTEAPGARIEARVAFDSNRGVVVLHGGTSKSSNETMNDTWEYAVTNLGNGEGCTAATASTCASGFCVDGVCCDVAACTGACRSCNVPGAVGTCTMVKAGAEVAGSCSAGQACDGNGSCLAKNGQPCASGSICASGFCADGVCCDGACTGACVACNQAGQEGTCRPYAAGTDPQSECSGGAGVCKATCDGVGSCAFPQKYTICGSCLSCDGKGSCSTFDSVCGAGGAGGYGGGTTKPYPTGGIGGSSSRVGGAGGTIVQGGAGGAGGLSSFGGSGDGGSQADAGTAGNRAGGAGGWSAGSGGASAIAGSGGVSAVAGSGGVSAIAGSGGVSAIAGSGGVSAIAGSGGASAFAGSGGAMSTGAVGGATSAGAGGSTGRVDAGVGDASAPVQLNRGGCSCVLGGSETGRALPSLLVLLAGALFAFGRRPRRSY
jgi:hypothetical protein